MWVGLGDLVAVDRGPAVGPQPLTPPPHPPYAGGMRARTDPSAVGAEVSSAEAL
jgi:hypothetical protein